MISNEVEKNLFIPVIGINGRHKMLVLLYYAHVVDTNIPMRIEY